MSTATLSTLHQTKWIQCLRPNPTARLRLFCFPFAGGSAAAYYSWPAILPNDIEVCAVQLPGRGSRITEEPYRDLKSLVPILVENLLPWLDAPIACFGHSMGALIAFEFTRYLLHQNQIRAEHLLVSGCGSPRVPRSSPELHQLSDARFVEQVSERYDGIPSEILSQHELLQLVVPTLRADFTLVEMCRYQKQDLLTCPISVFGGLADPATTISDLEAWQSETRNNSTLHMLPGGHFFLRSAQTELLQMVSDMLA